MGIAVALAAVICTPAFGGTVVVNLGGGWEATVFDPENAVVTSDAPGADFISFHIDKDFTDPPGVGGLFPAINILFSQTAPDEATETTLVLDFENIMNMTGANWDDYHWQLLDGGDVWFDVPASLAWDVSPFTNPATFTDPGGIFGDVNKATHVDANGGLVPDGGSFSPGLAAGDLVMKVNLNNSEEPLNFTLKQFPTPEPSTVLLIGFGAVVLARRRR
ncbi:MAG: PEP-CTERM sorting domain-containing protein [Planctomycetota bacterium]|nr:PEP-CTERM sorting domain-containing protein [Planctomycetota bacterium]